MTRPAAGPTATATERVPAGPGREIQGLAAIFTLAAPQARNGPTDIFVARIGQG